MTDADPMRKAEKPVRMFAAVHPDGTLDPSTIGWSAAEARSKRSNESPWSFWLRKGWRIRPVFVAVEREDA